MFKEVIHVVVCRHHKARNCPIGDVHPFIGKMLRKAVTYVVLSSHINMLLGLAYADVTPLGPESRYDYGVSLNPTKGASNSYNLVLRSRTNVLIEQQIHFAQALCKNYGTRNDNYKFKPSDPESPPVLQSGKDLVSYHLAELGEIVVSSQGDLTLRTDDSVRGASWHIRAKGQTQFCDFAAARVSLKAKSALFTGVSRVDSLNASGLRDFVVHKNAALVAQGLKIKTHQLFNNGELSGDKLSLKAEQATNQGYLIGRRILSINSGNKFDNLGVTQGDKLTIDSGKLLNHRGASLGGAEELILKSKRATNKGLVHSQGRLEIGTNDEFNNKDGGRIVTKHLQLSGAGQFINMSDGLMPETTEVAGKTAGILASGWTKFKDF